MDSVDLLIRKTEKFVLWAPEPGPAFNDSNPPYLVIGISGGNEGDFTQHARVAFCRVVGKDGLWEVDPKTIAPPLAEGIYYYWFEVQDTSPESWGKMLVTDPMAYTVDYSVTQESNDQERKQPAAVIKYRDGKLWPCDTDGTEPFQLAVPDEFTLPANNHLVIYELPTSWAKVGNDTRGVDVDVGTFADVLALFSENAPGKHFASIAEVHRGAILAELGINALELLPAADAKTKDEWGYATADYFAPDCDLGSATDLDLLVKRLHSHGARFFTDVVMAFGHDSYGYIDFKQFHLRPYMEPSNPDSYQSHANGVLRDGYGGQSWRYDQTATTYDPESGTTTTVHPAWALHRVHLARWMRDFGVDGLRLDSVNNIGNWAFVHSYKTRAWDLHKARYGPSADPSKFLVIGEELSMPIGMIQQGTLDALWNEPWQTRLRAVLLGETTHGDNFEWTVRKLADCTLDDLDGAGGHFTDGAQAVNYITSHDIEGFRKERLYDFLASNGLGADDGSIERRAKLAFALLLTSVGIPMIFAGEEFADKMDRSVDRGKKQTDPVNYARKNDGGWRQRLFGYVANLVRFRTQCPALGVDDTQFVHVDGSRGGRVLAWVRGRIGDGRQGCEPVVVVANFTGEDTPGTEYVVPNWPDRGCSGWWEVTQQREVPDEWVGREPLMSWEAKVYTRWRP